MITAKEIRSSFLEYFQSKEHTIVPSAPMVIKDDPTLMFTNAGMNQFKDIILGNREPKHRRCTDSQKCLRVSGKHNDLEEVGHDTYHHTMFEMLGNWSFGDYFKKEMISWAYDYLVNVLKINKNILYVTVFEGDEKDQLERDNEAASYWEEYFPKDHIINGNKHDNFWEMGEIGPCGPCSEIHIDIRSEEEKEKIPGAELVNKDHPQVIEIWNIVFMQYNRKANKSLEPLPAKVIDTGMGFERLCMVLQNKKSNYDTDVFQPLITKISELSGIIYGKEKEKDVAMRVIADHLRAICFSIADGQLPSNAKAGYVIRRILRRAVRYGYTFLAQKEAFLYKLIPTLVREMGGAYPELEKQKSLVTKVIKEEEESFFRTLSTGITLLEGVIKETKDAGKTIVDGTQVFTLFDTFGFPLDLTELICSEQGLRIDEKIFNEEMQKQKQRARNAATVETGDWIILNEGETEFTGYDHLQNSCQILRYREVKQKKKTFFEIVLDKTPFYAEMGGEVGDKGMLKSQTENIRIIDTKSENNLTVHISEKIPTNPNADFVAIVNKDERIGCENNHTATHLVDQALREILGTHVEQRGSLVSPNSLRFDFSHFQKVTNEEIRQVERIVNKRIRENIVLEEYRNLAIEEAKKMGAIALFGEKYGDSVRVVKFGKSIELCGGCHAKSTGQLGIFRIISETSVAAGIRRIEAITGKEAEDYIYQTQDTLDSLRSLFNNSKNLIESVEKIIQENTILNKQIESFLQQRLEIIKNDLIKNAYTREGIKIIKSNLELSAAAAKDLAFKINASEKENLVCVLGTKENEKPMLTVILSKNLIENKKINAGQLVRIAAKEIQGGGGGAPHFATAGGKDVNGLDKAIDKVLDLIFSEH